jgi:ribonuclease P protein component
MLTRSHRLAAKSDFARLFAKGRPFHARGLTLKAAPNGRAETRVGFVVSTKVSKRAVVRNRIRRRLREIVRLRLETLRPGFDVAFIVKAELVPLEHAELVQTVEYLLEKTGLHPSV